MKLIYTHENRFMVANAHNILAQAGIEVVWKNEFAAGAIGEISPFDTWPELWVIDEADYDRAVLTITHAVSTSNEPEWACATCGETNDAAFETCWNCQTEKAEAVQ